MGELHEAEGASTRPLFYYYEIIKEGEREWYITQHTLVE